MSRPIKTGLDYFPMNVNFNDSFKALEELHGNDGFTWMVKFWQAAYKTQDGKVDLSGIRGVLMAKQARITPEKQREIIKDAKSLDLIEEYLPDFYTSDGIQKTLAKVNTERENGRIRQKKSYSANNNSSSPN
jgi:hypothetical protein